MKRVLIWVGRVLLTLVIILSLALWYALSSQRVAQWAVNFGLKHAPAGITVGQVRGRLRGPLYITAVGYHTPAMQVAVDSIAVDWRLSHLLHKQLQLDVLHMIGVRVTLADSAPPDTTTQKRAPSKPHLPVDIAMGDVLIRGVTVHARDTIDATIDSIRLSGHATDYRLSLAGSVTQPAISRVTLRVRSRGSLTDMTLDSAMVGVLRGRVTAAGKLAWYPAVQWDLALAVDSVQPSHIMADTTSWPGTISLNLATRGAIDSNGPSATFQLDSLRGNLKRQPLSGVARGAYRDSVVRLDTLDAAWGSAHVAATGKIGATLDVQYAATIANLGTVSPGTAGSIALAGNARGSRTAPHLLANGNAHRIVSGTSRVARATLHADVDLAPRGVIDLKLIADSIIAAARPVREVSLQAHGTRDLHRVALAVLSDQGQLHLVGGGGYHAGAWQGRIDSINLDSTSKGAWRIRRAAALTISAQLVRMDTLCLIAVDSMGDQDSTNAWGCVAGKKQQGGWAVAASLQQLPLQWFASPSSNAADTVTGTVTAQLQANAVGKRIAGMAHVAAVDAAISVQQPGAKKSQRVALDSAALDATIGATGTRATLVLHVSDAEHHDLARVDGSATLAGLTTLGGNMSGQSLDATLDGTAADLHFLAPFMTAVDSLAGSFALSATANGTIGAPHIIGEMHLAKLDAVLRNEAHVTGAIDAKADITPHGAHSASNQLSLTPHDIRYNYRDLGRNRFIAVNGSGIVFSNDGTGGHGKVDLQLDTDNGRRAATLAATLDLPQYGSDQPRARQQVHASLNGDLADLSIFQPFMVSVDSLRGTLKLEAQVSNTVGAPEVTSTLALDSLRALLPFGSMLRGAIAADLQLSVREDSTLQGKFSLTPKPLTFDYRENETSRRVALDSSAITATVGRDGLHGTLAVTFADSGRALGNLRGTITLPQYRRRSDSLGAQRVDGSLTGAVSDLSFIKAFTPLIDSAAGTIALDSKISGQMADSRLIGSFEAHRAALRLPRLGITLDQLELTAHGDQQGAVTLNASMHSGSGTLTVAGTSPTRPTAAAPGKVHIEGTNFAAANSAQLRAVVSPKIDVTITDQVLQIRGDVGVPIARLQLANIPPSAIAPSDDVVLADSINPKKKGPGVDTDVRVTFGDSVSFSGFNFNAKMSGGLRVMQVPGQLATASGAIVIDSGTYKAYGQDLLIQNGQVRFAGGPIDNPGLNIRAARTAQDSVVAGLDIKGTLKQPDVTIFSEPAMSQTEALSYIVTGHGVGQGSGSSGNLLSKGLSALGLRGGNAIAGALGHELHLDEARIEAEGDIKKAAFVAGTYLSPNLYVSYGIGLFDPVSTLRLRYMVSNHFTVQAETGNATGADVLVKTTKN